MKALDKIDIALLKHLEKDSKQTVKALALEVGLSVSPTFERIKRLEKRGLIKGYTVELEPKELGLDLLVFCQVSLASHSESSIKGFQDGIGKLDQVVACYHVTGDSDYLLKVYAKNMEDYQQFIVKKLSKIENVSKVQSSFVMAEVKADKKGLADLAVL